LRGLLLCLQELLCLLLLLPVSGLLQFLADLGLLLLGLVPPASSLLLLPILLMFSVLFFSFAALWPPDSCPTSPTFVVLQTYRVGFLALHPACM
jgi:hypothetical protein